ncbi:hypothetical protein V5O48_001867 [Marasmius crinis-equi]|uniref:Uncharacterized protein n=1 Tax=Marasmius crinis-equi TaxID=585013 RepID=A0ABR3FX76_9AGAR
MTFGTHNNIVSLFPYSTFWENVTVVCSSSATERAIRSQAEVRKLQGREWATLVIPSTALVCRINSEFLSSRRVGDRSTWVVDLGDPTNDDILWCNTWDQNIDHSRCFNITFNTGIRDSLRELVSRAVDVYYNSPVLREVVGYIQKTLQSLPADSPSPDAFTIYHLRRRLSGLYVSLSFPPALSFVVETVGDKTIARVMVHFPSRLYKRDGCWITAECMNSIERNGYVITPRFGYPPSDPPSLRFRNDKEFVASRESKIFTDIRRQIIRSTTVKLTNRRRKALLAVLPAALNLFNHDAFEIHVEFDRLRGINVSVHLPFGSLRLAECPVRFLLDPVVGHELAKEGVNVVLYDGSVPWLG